MDNKRFDSLVKSLASGSNRRSVLKGVLGLGAAASLGGTLLESDASAARRPTPTPKLPTCPGSQHWDGTRCACASGEICGPDCCPVGAECCDNACCYGHCYGEELCCSADNWCEATDECCPDGATCCDEQGCVVIEEGDCGCDGVCPDGFECCGSQCCSAGFCAGETCCALGVCAGECIDFEGVGCCDGELYEIAFVICCDGKIHLKDGNVCCDDVAYPGNCCIDTDCPTCVRCENHVCGEPRC